MSIPRYLLIALSKTHCFFSNMAVWTFFNRQVLSSPRPPNRQVPVPKRDTGTESDGTHKLGWEGWQLDSDGKKGRDSTDGQHSGWIFVFFVWTFLCRLRKFQTVGMDDFPELHLDRPLWMRGREEGVIPRQRRKSKQRYLERKKTDTPPKTSI